MKKFSEFVNELDPQFFQGLTEGKDKEVKEEKKEDKKPEGGKKLPPWLMKGDKKEEKGGDDKKKNPFIKDKKEC